MTTEQGMMTLSGTCMLRSAQTSSPAVVVENAYAPVMMQGSIMRMPTEKRATTLRNGLFSARGTAHRSSASSTP